MEGGINPENVELQVCMRYHQTDSEAIYVCTHDLGTSLRDGLGNTTEHMDELLFLITSQDQPFGVR